MSRVCTSLHTRNNRFDNAVRPTHFLLDTARGTSYVDGRARLQLVESRVRDFRQLVSLGSVRVIRYGSGTGCMAMVMGFGLVFWPGSPIGLLPYMWLNELPSGAQHTVQSLPPPSATGRGRAWPASGCTALSSPRQPGLPRGHAHSQTRQGDQTLDLPPG